MAVFHPERTALPSDHDPHQRHTYGLRHKKRYRSPAAEALLALIGREASGHA